MDVLWVEDIYDAVSEIASSLHRAGNAITFVRSRQDAERLLETGWRFNLVLLDSKMPDLGGRAVHSGPIFLRGLREGRWGDWGKTVKVIFITAFGNAVVNALRGYEAPNILGKPITSEEALPEMARLAPGLSVVADGHATVSIGAIGNQNTIRDMNQTAYPELTPDLRTAIKEMARAWMQQGDDTGFEAATRISQVIGDSRSSSEVRGKLEAFRVWCSTLGDEAKAGLMTAAAAVTVATPLLQALGLV